RSGRQRRSAGGGEDRTPRRVRAAGGLVSQRSGRPSGARAAGAAGRRRQGTARRGGRRCLASRAHRPDHQSGGAQQGAPAAAGGRGRCAGDPSGRLRSRHMKLVVTLVFAVFASQAALAQEAKPSEASVRQLFEVMHSSKLLDAYMTQIDTTMRASMQQALAGQQLNPKQQKILDDMGRQIGSLVKAELNWPAIEPLMIDVYRNSFSQHDVDGMLASARSEAGQ